MDDAKMTLPILAGVIDMGIWRYSEFVIPAKARHPRESPSSPRKRGSMDDDWMMLSKFAGVIDFLEKQEIGRSSTNDDACQDRCYADILVHGSQPSAG
jgi:hypothetical protein